ncbi:hypothetical protein [Halobacillus litoralis]|uniref:hypothetical protein n=1 Tax=Halobacillus litoralis TaxID=45668 RepID=UPI00248F5D66|nr:hypothetical protein [Halobacillus litoralis]
MLAITRVVLAVICIGISTYVSITVNDNVLPYMFLFPGSLILVTGAAELKVNRWRSFPISLLHLYY